MRLYVLGWNIVYAVQQQEMVTLSLFAKVSSPLPSVGGISIWQNLVYPAARGPVVAWNHSAKELARKGASKRTTVVCDRLKKAAREATQEM